MHNMLIYANQAMTSHQYNIWTKKKKISVETTVWPPV